MQAVADRMVLALPDFMAPPNNRKSERPHPLHISKSFTRAEPASPASTRVQRASTIQNGVIPEITTATTPDNATDTRSHRDAFERTSEDSVRVASSGTLPADFDELPIELASLCDSFIDSLSAKVHPTPPTVDKLSGLFQDFYAIAANHINTHISTLSSRQHRESSPTPSTSSIASTASKFRAKAASISNKDRPKPAEKRESEQQMLTAEEISDRKRARRLLEHKRVALEEAVERRVCEGIYHRIWRHRSTQDEAQDEKLRSKTAALCVVGIGLADLGIDFGLESKDNPVAAVEKAKEVREWLDGAREELVAMNEEKYPLGKLQHLKTAHKAIVDTLSHFHPSSSADEIMPMLIYTLITSRPEGIDVISNLYFIQRFRNENKIDGEAAYCLTNLEAAITFLETVDLASLREDETPSGPPKSSSRPNTPRTESYDPMSLGITPASGMLAPELNSATASPILSKGQPSPSGLRPATQVHNRRLSELLQPPAYVLGAAGDAVLNTADQGFKTIGNSLGDSYKFLLGKLKERQEESTGQNNEIIVPKTLEDARKLISTPPLEDDGSISGASSLHTPEATERKRADSGAKADDKVLNLIGGRKVSRDRSVDSARSVGSNKKVAFVEEGGEKSPSPLQNAPLLSANPAIVESMRNLGNSLNPMNRIAGIGMIRGFGRATPPTPAAPATSKPINDGGIADLSTVSNLSTLKYLNYANETQTFPDLAPVLPPKEAPKIAPPIKKFLDLQNPGDMKLNEVLELLRDYRRLAGALKDMGAV